MGKYDDIINRDYKQSDKRPHMSMSDRAAQFAPFAALTGFEDNIEEAENEARVLAENEILHSYEN